MLPEWYKLRTHCEVLGTSQSGKSKFLEFCERRLIKKGQAYCKIDWHGTGFDNTLSYLAAIKYDKPVILLNPSRPDFIVPFNPFQKRSEEISSQVSRNLSSILNMWGAENSNEQPTLERIAKMTFGFSIISGEPIQHSAMLLKYHKQELRDYAIRIIENEAIKQQWEELQSIPRREWLHMVLSTENRLGRLLSSRGILRFIGHRNGNLDIARVIEEGTIVLVNLGFSPYLDREAARTFATLLLDDFFDCAMYRARNPKPYFLLLDEAYNYISRDTGRMLDEVIKTGLRATLVHHHSGQIRDPHIAGSLKTNARIKVVFGGIPYEDATGLVNNHLIDRVNERMIKEIRHQWVTRHKLEEYETHTESYTEGESEEESVSRGRSRSVTSSEGYSDSMGESGGEFSSTGKSSFGELEGESSQFGADHGTSLSSAWGSSSSESSARSKSITRSNGTNYSEGEAVSRSTRYAPYQEREVAGHEDYTREERVSMFAATLMNQKPWHCTVLLPQGNHEAREVPPIKYKRGYSPGSWNVSEYERELNREAMPAHIADSLLQFEEKRFLQEATVTHEPNGTGRPKRRKR
jgi:hypothetical protein